MAGELILLADDDLATLDTMAEGLSAAGYRVVTATGGHDAVRIAGSESPDLAILDVRMPDLSGIEAAKIIDGELGVPVMYLSAHGDTETVEAAVEKGAMGFLVKPVNAGRIIPSIEAALRRARDMGRLTGALETGKSINRAIGVVMERYRLSAAEAFELIRRNARSRRIKVVAVAEEVLKAVETINAVDSRYDPK